MARWAGIVRVSHMGARQSDADNFHSEREQVETIKNAVPPGDDVHFMPPELNISGGLPLEQRPSLLAAVEGVERGQYAGIIVAYLSRLGRNVREQLRTFDRVHAAGGRIIVAQEGIDARTRGGRLQRNILAAIHEDEREMHVERFDTLRQKATANGIWQRRQTPRGYDRDPNTRRLVPNDDAPKVVEAFKMRAAGHVPVNRIGEFLGMTNSGVRALLRNRVYLGELRVGDYVNPNAHPPLVDEQLWLAAQKPSALRPPRTAKEPALLAGLVRCAGCGHVMSRGATASVVYSCHGRHSLGPCPAPASITAKTLDEYVEPIALRRLARVSLLASRDNSFENARERLRKAETELAAYLEAVSAADIGAAAFAEGARQRRQEIDTARGELERIASRHESLGDLDVVRRWPELTVAERNHVLRGLLEAVVVRKAGRGKRIPVEDRVRIVRYGAGVVDSPYRGGGAGMPIVSLEWLDEGDERVLREAG